MNILREYVQEFHDGRDLAPADSELFLDALIDESDEALLAELFRAWNEKDISANEIYEIARIMRSRCTPVVTKHSSFVDIVGTGGSRSKTFNVSTAAAFVVAGAGVPVAKHGNKAATSSSGSADVLSELGVDPSVDAETAGRYLDEIGVCFMFAPNFHRLSPTLAKVRRGLGFPTIFNCVGPLCNPANAPHRIIGVWKRELVSKMACALSRLGTKRSWIVHGHDGLDELSISGPTLVAEIDGDEIRAFDAGPEDFGLRLSVGDSICVDSANQSARLIRKVLNGECTASAAHDLVAINAAAAIFVAGKAANLPEAARLAAASIEGGNAGRKLEELRDGRSR